MDDQNMEIDDENDRVYKTWLVTKFVDSMKDQAGTREQLNITS